MISNPYRKCPICGKKINYLLGYSDAKYYVEFNSKNNDLTWTEASDSLEATAFECPECGNELFNYESTALDFLKSGKLPEKYKSFKA